MHFFLSAIESGLYRLVNKLEIGNLMLNLIIKGSEIDSRAYRNILLGSQRRRSYFALVTDIIIHGLNILMGYIAFVVFLILSIFNQIWVRQI